MPQVTHTGVTVTADDLRKIETVIDRLDHNDQEGALDELQAFVDYIVGEYRNGAVIPTGWRLVPRKLTPEMEDAADRRDDDEPMSDWGKIRHASRQAIWDAELAAAPEPSP